MSMTGPNVHKLTHASLLRILPFACGYLCDEETGKPCAASVTVAMLFQAMIASQDPYAEPDDYEN